MTDLPRLTPDAVRHIVENLRARDREEIAATNYDLDPEAMVARYMGLADMAFVASVEGRPAAIIGAWPMWPTVWTVFAFGTDDFEAAAPTLTKFAHRWLIPCLEGSGARRAMCWSLWTHAKAHRWLKSLGLREEAVLPAFGRNGETFIQFARVRDV